MMNSEAVIFQQAAAQGQTVVAASGDGGSTGCCPSNTPNKSATPAAPGGASSGGVSAYKVLSGPGNYQSGISGAGYSNACGAAVGSACRQVPDVSAVADPATGYLVAFGQLAGGGQYWGIIGGTSGAAPLWAAIAALADASHSCAANGTLGLMNPALYQSQSALTDITTGNNNLTSSGYTGGLYQAGTGYYMATGLGTPKAPALVEALCAAKPAVGVGGTLGLQVAGASGVPSSGVSAVVLNVTATEPTGSSFLTVYSDGAPRPTSSNLNFTANQTIPNLVPVPVGANGKVDFYNLNGTVHVVADLFGYFTSTSTSTSTGYKFHASTPQRLVDTRTGVGVAAGQVTPIGTGGVLSLPLTDTAGLGNTGPLASAAALVLNVTVTEPNDSSFVTVYPSGVARPLSSNLNFTPGQTIPNAVVTPVNGSSINFYNNLGNVQVVADLCGYYATN